MPREKTLSSPSYWFEKAQNELFRQFHYYMEHEKINQTQLAERLGITKGRVSQILRGESNFTIKTLMELALSINTIPKINYVPIEEEVESDNLKRVENELKRSSFEKKSQFEISIPIEKRISISRKNLINPTVKMEIIKGDKFTKQTDMLYKQLA